MSEQMPVLPAPTPTAQTKPYWKAGTEGRLVVQRCTNCGMLRHPPTGACWNCQSLDSEWFDMPGTGTVYSFIWNDRAIAPVFESLGVYNVSVVELDGVPEGNEPVRIVSRVNGVDKDTLHIGMPVTVEFDPCGEEIALPVFRPA